MMNRRCLVQDMDFPRLDSLSRVQEIQSLQRNAHELWVSPECSISNKISDQTLSLLGLHASIQSHMRNHLYHAFISICVQSSESSANAQGVKVRFLPPLQFVSRSQSSKQVPDPTYSKPFSRKMNKHNDLETLSWLLLLGVRIQERCMRNT